ncbi:MAG: hypothetical protein NXH75_07515 [Halobacteriovoraceae bacterium]|nr:hypothetical protein [Halobacteriovoraceae bacterium]
MNLNGYKFNLLLVGLLFSLLYLPVMNRPYSFEELRLTSHFQKSSQQDNFLLSKMGKKEDVSSQWDQYGKEYLKLYPPFLMGFYFVWSKVSSEDEVLMRLPLLLLILWAGYELFQMMALLWGKDEASLFLLTLTLFPWVYSSGTSIIPSSFGLYMGVISLSLFLRTIKESKKTPKRAYLINLLGLLTLYQFSLLLLTQVFVGFIIKEKKKYFIPNLTYLFLIVSLWVTYFSAPSTFGTNPLTFYWGAQNPKDFFKFIEVLLTGVLNA